MIIHNFVQCDFCKTKIFLRFQVEKLDIPFDFCCPGCKVHIHGTKCMQNENKLDITNAKEDDCSLDEIDYYANFSVELPHKKIAQFISLEQMIKDGFSPFISTSQLFEQSVYLNIVSKTNRFIFFRDRTWNKILPLYDLYFNKRIDLTKEPFLEISQHYTVKNELDVAMSLHQLTVLGFNNILPDKSLERFTSVAEKIMLGLDITKVYAFIKSLGGKEYFSSVLKRLIKIYSRWMSDFEKYLPIVMVALGSAENKFDKGIYGIATTSFDDVKSFYADSYELILDIIDVAVGLNNILVRGDYNIFSPDANVVDFAAYRNKIKIERLKLLVSTEFFSREINLNRNVRNAIAHYDYEFESSSQMIIFNDKYKGKQKIVEMYLSDLTLLCYDNIKILVYLDELMYVLRKLDYCIDGLNPNIGYFGSEINDNK